MHRLRDILARSYHHAVTIMFTPDTRILYPRQIEVCIVCEECGVQDVLSFPLSKKIKTPRALHYPLSAVLQFMHSFSFVRVSGVGRFFKAELTVPLDTPICWGKFPDGLWKHAVRDVQQSARLVLVTFLIW